MADKRISQLVERVDIANNDVVPIVASGATTTNKATISSIQTFMQENLDVGVTSVGITIGTSGTDVNVTGSPVTTSGNITINIPTASATNRGLLSAADWTTFNNKQDAGSFVTLNTAQTITAQKTFTTGGSSDTMIISHGSGSGFALDVIKAGNNEAIRVTKTSGSGNAMSITGGNFSAEDATFSSDIVVNGVNAGRGGGSLANNTRFGTSALASNTTGTANTSIGASSLSSNTTGGLNTSIGTGSLQANSIGSSNTSVGVNSLLSNTGGDSNTSVGNSSLSNNTTGDNNTSVGSVALYSNSTGNANTANGFGALYSNTEGNSNVAVGSYSLYSNTTATGNTSSGYYSLFSNTTGGSNTATGYVALSANTIGNANTANGAYALENNTTGSDNTAVGQNALEANTTANGNTGIGFSALQSNTIGDSNTAAGRNALRSNTAGNSNTAFGWESLSFNTVSGANTAVGNQALRFNTGGENTAVGFLALYENTTGQNNTALGESALLRNTTGSNNIGIGNDAGSTTPSGQNTTSSNSIFIGGSTMGAANNQTNQIVIGHNAIGNGSNTVTIGNDSITNTYLKGAATLTGALNGTSASFTGRARFQGTGFDTLGSAEIMLTNTTASTGRSFIVNSSNAGEFLISDVSAGQTRLSINNSGAVTLTGALNGTSAVFSEQVRINQAGQSLLIFPTTTSSARMQIQSSGGGNLVVGTESSAGGDLASGTSAYASVFTSGSTRDLFIGTNSVQRLKIDGSTGAATFSSSVTATTPSGSSETLRLICADTIGDGFISYFRSSGVRKAYIGYGGSNDDNFSISQEENAAMLFNTNNTERMRITSEGYLGTTVTSTTVSSGDLLGVLSFVSKDSSTYSSGGITNIRSYATSTYNTGNVAGDLRFYVSNGLQNTTGTYLFGTEAMRITSDGKVGIGTDSPGYDGAGYGAVRYVTINNASGTGSNLELATGTTANDGYVGAVDFINTSNTGASGPGRYGIASIRGFTTNASATNTGGGYLTFNTKADGGSGAERMRITSGGSVGIGTASPSNILEAARAAANNNIILTESSDSGLDTALFYARRSRGTSLSSPTAIQAGNNMGGLAIGAYNGSTYAIGAKIKANANQNWTTSAQGTNLIFETTADNSTTLTERMRITSGGNVLIGETTSNGYPLEVNGRIYANGLRSSSSIFGFFKNSANSFEWEIGSDGSVGTGMYIYNSSGGYALTLSSAGVLSTLGGGTSDRRKKEDIKYINESALPFINELNPVSFKFKNDISKKIRRGFIAQEVLETSIPSLVLGDGEKEGGIYGLDYDGILALAVKAIQELKTEIDSLKNQMQ